MSYSKTIRLKDSAMYPRIVVAETGEIIIWTRTTKGNYGKLVFSPAEATVFCEAIREAVEHSSSPAYDFCSNCFGKRTDSSGKTCSVCNGTGKAHDR